MELAQLIWWMKKQASLGPTKLANPKLACFSSTR